MLSTIPQAKELRDRPSLLLFNIRNTSVPYIYVCFPLPQRSVLTSQREIRNISDFLLSGSSVAGGKEM